MAIVLVVLIVFGFAGSMIFQARDAEAVWGMEAETYYVMNRWETLIDSTIKNIHDFVFFPMVASMVIRLADAASDLPNWASSATSFTEFFLDAAMAEAINTILGINICGDLALNLKLSLFQYVVPDFFPECTLSRALDQFEDMKDSGFSNFGLTVGTTGGDPGVFFEMYGSSIDTKERWERGLANRLTAGQGFLGLSSCKDGNYDNCKEWLPGSIVKSLVETMYTGPWKAMYASSGSSSERYIALGKVALSVLAMSSFNKLVTWGVQETFKAREEYKEERVGR